MHDVQNVLEVTDEKRKRWEWVWDQRQKQLEQNLKLCALKTDFGRVC